MKLSHKDITNIYNKLKDKSSSLYSKNRYLESLKYITTASKWAYRFNFIYFDPHLEQLIKQISDISLPKISCDENTNRFLILETHGMDNRGLTQQYIRAFMSMNVEFMYVSVQCKRSECPDILRELESYAKAKVVLFDPDDLDEIEKANRIISIIDKYKPSKVFLHLMPWDVVSLMVTHSINGAIKYNINLTDHAFWLGASFIDYNFEFRSYGKTVSLEKRGLQESQLLYLPYYPILPKDKVEFQGFPSDVKGKMILFTGGAFYKMFGKNDSFFRLIDILLDLSDDLVLLIAGGGDFKLMNKKLSNLKNRKRIYLIGNRKDISEVFNACDIYLDTYPIGGGLMEQFAALYEKPILALSDSATGCNNQDNIIRTVGNGVCSFRKIEELVSYAKFLVENKGYRQEEGKKNLNIVPSVAEFNTNFKTLVTNHSNILNWATISISYEKYTELYLEVENKYTNRALRDLLKSLKCGLFVLYPSKVLGYIECLCRYVKHKLFK